jgi:hypothetical protein
LAGELSILAGLTEWNRESDEGAQGRPYTSYAIRPGPTIVRRGNKPLPLAVVFQKRFAMPAWMEVLINVIGYAGFVAIAMYHRSSSKKLPERDPH